MGRFADLITQHTARYEHMGRELAPNGAVRTGFARHVPGGAWLHVVYPGLNPDRIGRMVQLIRRRLPDALREFYLDANGLNYFFDTFIMTGLPTGSLRTSDTNPQPYSIETLNVQERPGDAADDIIFIGAYDYDLSRIFMREDDSRVFYCAADSAVPLGEWPSLYDCLSSEFARLDRLRDRKGELLDLERSPLPFGR